MYRTIILKENIDKYQNNLTMLEENLGTYDYIKFDEATEEN